MKKSTFKLGFGLSLLSLAAILFSFRPLTNGSNTGMPAPMDDYSFVVFGCNRVENADTVGNASTANVYQLTRMFDEIAAMNPLPKFLFVTGDLIIGYEKDTVRLAREYQSWIKLYKASALAKTPVKVICMPGNHESDQKINGKKVPVAVAERVFVREMKDFIVGENGPKITGQVAGTDSLTTDQRKLTYSFDYGKDHFVVINTDPVGLDSRVAWHWIKADVQKAHKNGARNIFTFGHKPAYTSTLKKGVSTDGLDNYTATRDSFWTSLENVNAVGMLVAHNHLWDAFQPHVGKTWQVIAGNAGSKLEKVWASTPHAYFGYTVISVAKQGTVELNSYGRDIDTANYNLPTPKNPTTLRKTLHLK